MENIKTFSIDAITGIKIKSALTQINVVSGSGPEIVLRWTVTKRRVTEVVVEDKVLIVKDRAEVALYGIVGLIKLKEDKELTLELPPEFVGMVQVESKDECVRILGVAGPCSLQAKTVIGGIEVFSTDLESYDLTSQGGGIILHSVTSQKGINVHTKTGSIECHCAENAENYLLDCHSEHGMVDLPSTAGRGKKRLCLRSKTGRITVAFEDKAG